MAQEDVNIKVTANVAEAIRLWKEMSKGPKQMADEMAAMGKKGKKANLSIAQSIGKSVKQWIVAKVAVEGVSQAMKAYLSDLRQMGREALESGLKLDLLITKMRLQQELNTPKAAGKAASRAVSIGQQLGVSVEVALATQTELASQGFDPGALRVALESQIATNKGRDASVAIATVRAQGRFLDAAQLPKNAANLRKLSVNVASLFGDTPLQPEDLEQMALQARDLRSKGFSPDETLAIIGQISKSLGPRRAGTGLRTVVSRLASKDTEVVKGLKTLGLRPTDVDFVGESPLEVSERLGTAIRATRASNPEALELALKRIAGLENVSALLAFSETKDLRENISKLGNEDRFKANLAIFGSSRGAVNQRIRNEIDLGKASRVRLATITQETEQFEQSLIDNSNFGNRIPFVGFMLRKAQTFAFEEARLLGATKESAENVRDFSKFSSMIFPPLMGLRVTDLSARVFADTLTGADEQPTGVNVNVKLTNELGAEEGNVSAVQGASEDE